MTAPKNTALARRRKESAELATVAASVPAVYVESPLQTVLATVERVIAVEIAFMERTQRQTGAEMSPTNAKKLSNLMLTLEKSVNVGREISEHEGSEMSDEELARELVVELERLKAKGVRI